MRYDRVDALRGAAMLWMTAFHFAFDLAHFRWITADLLRDPFWVNQRTAIVSLFLFCAGLGQAIALAQGQGWLRFGRRWLQVAGAALLVTAGSWLMFPTAFIYFGVLHGIAVMLVIARLTAGWGAWLWLLGLAVFALKYVAEWAIGSGAWPDALNNPAWNWLGLVDRKPFTQDYVPLVPWLGIVWWGMATGQWVLRRRPEWITGPLPAPLHPLATLGRFSLSYYLLHQPVLIGLVVAAGWAFR